MSVAAMIHHDAGTKRPHGVEASHWRGGTRQAETDARVAALVARAHGHQRASGADLAEVLERELTVRV